VKMQRHLPIILAGDFNENIHAEHQKLMTMLQSIGLTHSLYFEQYEYMPSYRRTNPLVNNWLNREKYSRRLDYIFVGLPEECDLKIRQYEPMYLTPPLSDHDPVFLSLAPYAPTG